MTTPTPADAPTIDCLCGDIFPSVETFHEHLHLSHPEADSPQPEVSVTPEGETMTTRETKVAVVNAILSDHPEVSLTTPLAERIVDALAGTWGSRKPKRIETGCVCGKDHQR